MSGQLAIKLIFGDGDTILVRLISEEDVKRDNCDTKFVNDCRG